MFGVLLLLSDVACSGRGGRVGDASMPHLDAGPSRDGTSLGEVGQASDGAGKAWCPWEGMGGSPGGCIPLCSHLVCGPDGCGGVCGFCDPGSLCHEDAGVCECAATCLEKECGDEGCGGSCGMCAEGQLCAGTYCIQKGEMLLVPAGPFWMGCNEYAKELGCGCGLVDSGQCSPTSSTNCPYHEVDLPEFAIDATETTVAEFLEFLNAHGNVCSGEICILEHDYSPIVLSSSGIWEALPERHDSAVSLLTWFGARDYCDWRGKRLCSEAEWEKAARGGCEYYADCTIESRVYPWGYSEPDCAKAHWFKCGTEPLLVGSHPAGASPYGALDMAGNVPEWVADWFYPDYQAAESAAGTVPEPASWYARKVHRGGGGNAHWVEMRNSMRGALAPETPAVGVRCCMDAL